MAACIIEPNNNDHSNDHVTKPNVLADDIINEEKKTMREDVHIAISLMQEHIKTKASFDLSISCYNPSDINDTYHRELNHIRDIITLPKYHCHITIHSYDDGIRKFTPLHNALVIEIDHHGIVNNALPKAYQSSPEQLLMWLEVINTKKPWDLSLSSSLYLLSGDGKHHKSSNKTITTTPVTLSISNVPSPSIDNITLFSEGNINSYGLSNEYTLVCTGISIKSTVTACKYIDNSNNTYDPTSWANVDQAFKHNEAIDCPSFDPADVNFTAGNFNHLWLPNKKTLIIWANTINGLNSYTTANIGPE